MAEDHAGKYYGRAFFAGRSAAEDFMMLVGFHPRRFGHGSITSRFSGFPTFYQAVSLREQVTCTSRTINVDENTVAH